VSSSKDDEGLSGGGGCCRSLMGRRCSAGRRGPVPGRRLGLFWSGAGVECLWKRRSILAVMEGEGGMVGFGGERAHWGCEGGYWGVGVV